MILSLKLKIIIVLFITACSSNKVTKNHGFISLDNKFENVIINKSNKNDIITNENAINNNENATNKNATKAMKML